MSPSRSLVNTRQKRTAQTIGSFFVSKIMLKKKIILILIVILAVVLGVFGLSQKPESKKVEGNNLPATQDVSASKEETKQVAVETNTSSSKNTLQAEEISSEDGQKINITFTIPQREFNITITEGASVYDLLSTIGQKENINFGFKNFSGLGFFVDSIDGVKSGSGKNWIYYINGKKAEEGISNYKLKAGDSILWKLEDEI